MESVTAIKPLRTLREGIEFTFRGRVPDESGEETGELVEIALVVPPLNLGALERFERQLKTFGQDDLQSMRTLVDALAAALLRNYDGVPKWLIAQTIDVANMPEMMRALMDVSGLRRREVEAEKKALMANPGPITSTPTPQPTGAESTQT